MDWDDFPWDDDEPSFEVIGVWRGSMADVWLNPEICCYTEIPCRDAAHDQHARQEDRG